MSDLDSLLEESLAMIRGHDDQRLVIPTRLLQETEQLADRGIHTGHTLFVGGHQILEESKAIEFEVFMNAERAKRRQALH